MIYIDLGVKFVRSNLKSILDKYWRDSLNAESVCFQFDRLEWISNTEMSFLISWINTLESNNIWVQITLQNSNIEGQEVRTYEKRKYCLEKIMNQWKFESHLSRTSTIIDGGISFSKTSSFSLLNFSALPIREYSTQTFDNDFDILYSQYLKDFTIKLKRALSQTEITYYDSNFLDYSIIKELYSNVCLHANSTLSKECFFSVGINKKFTGDSTFISSSRKLELSDLEKDFFTSENKYRNIDFVEINFHDFGQGISNSLRKKYFSENAEDLEYFFGENYESHLAQEPDSKILDYSLLLFTSQFEIERKLEIHDFIPRGLYILKMIISKYKGYLEIRSNEGAVSLSFKDGEEIRRYGKRSENVNFPGTQIKIVLPAIVKDKSIEKTTERILKGPALDKVNYCNINFLKELAEVELSLSLDAHSSSLFRDKGIIVSLFSKILNHFRSADKNDIIIIDFAGVEPKTGDFFNKFIYFIIHFPLSSQHRIILYNMVTKGLNTTIVFHDTTKLKSLGFTPFPIPCIGVDLEVEWLGMQNDDHSETFTQIWIGNNSNEITVENIKKYESSLITIEEIGDIFKITINLPPFSTILEKIDEIIRRNTENEINNIGIQFHTLTDSKEKNYNKISYQKENTCFLTANRKYLTTYISFNEKLYIYSYRRMMAVYFIMRLHNYFPTNKNIKGINKILSVTLSSQLIGNEVKEILNLLYSLSINLVALSNYYNFQNEERFNEIKSKDKVLIVNDVITTGTLTLAIIKSIEIKKAVPIGCLAIVDLRNSFPLSSDIPVLALAKAELKILDYPIPGYNVEVINPVLNVPASIPRKKSKENVLLNREEFLRLIDEKYFLIGNLKNGSVFFNYFLHTEALLTDDAKNKFAFLNKLLEALKKRKQDSNQAELKYLIKGLEIVSKNIAENKLSRDFIRIKNKLKRIEDSLSPELFQEYKIDAVFYPFLSNISIIENNPTPFLQTDLNPHTPIIYPIPRIMTSRGWRFSFPPKFLQTLFEKNKLAVLIIDDGSLTGETLMQMIDSVSFLSVKSIDVFSIFGRLEDFQKELFSRIRSIQVKDAVAPINVYFGVHFNIPVHNINVSPFHFEAREISILERKLEEDNISLSESFGKFLAARKIELEDTRHPTLGSKDYPLISDISKKELFIIRDFLGRFDSYRLYIDDFPLKNMDYLISNDQSILSLLTVLNLEPQLYQTFKRIFHDEQIAIIKDKIVNDFLDDNSLMDQTWKQEFFIKALFYLDPNTFFGTDNLTRLSEKLYKYVSITSSASFLYFEYILILIKLGIRTMDNPFASLSFDSNVTDFIFQLKKKENIFPQLRWAFSVYCDIQKNELLDYKAPINKYYKLIEYFAQVAVYQTYHDDRLLTNIFKDVEKGISVLEHAISKNFQEDFSTDLLNLDKAVKQLKEKYSQIQEFKFIRDIVTDLQRFSTTYLEFNVAELHNNVSKFEGIIEEPVSIEKSYLTKFKIIIEEYQSLLLNHEGDFASFIMKSECFLLSEWENAEMNFIKEKSESEKFDWNSFKINLERAENIKLRVSPYALTLAFENLLKNKFKYARNVSWKMYTEDHINYYEVFFEQQSAFKPDTGDGTGQHTIKSILRNYGVLYKQINSNPYTLRISFNK